MPSPFPGMSPYLEQDDVWHDFHKSFLPRLAEVLGRHLTTHYIAKIENCLYVHEPSSDRRAFWELGAGIGTSQRSPAGQEEPWWVLAAIA